MSDVFRVVWKSCRDIGTRRQQWFVLCPILSSKIDHFSCNVQSVGTDIRWARIAGCAGCVWNVVRMRKNSEECFADGAMTRLFLAGRKHSLETCWLQLFVHRFGAEMFKATLLPIPTQRSLADPAMHRRTFSRPLRTSSWPHWQTTLDYNSLALTYSICNRFGAPQIVG